MKITFKTYFGEDNEFEIVGEYTPEDVMSGLSGLPEDVSPPEGPSFEMVSCKLFKDGVYVDFDPVGIASWDSRMNMFHMLEEDIETAAIKHITENEY